jgi:hypothetical protein
MGFVRFVLWTACAMGLGVMMATVVVDGRTPLEHLKGAWSQHVTRPGHVDDVKTRFNEALEDARDALAEDAEQKPRERHSERDRDAVNAIIAKKK